MGTTSIPASQISIGEELHDAVQSRRIFYHDIEIRDGLRTRFEADYEEVPYLRRTDAKLAGLVQRLDELAEPGFSGRTVLDVGCGDGLFAFHAARRGAAHVTAVERNRYNFEHARFIQETAQLNNVSFLHGSIEHADLHGPFDDVFALGILYHVVSPLAVLHKLRSLCAQRLLVTVPIDLDTDDPAPLCRLDRYQTQDHGFWAFNHAFVRSLLDTAGFSLINEVILERHAESGRPSSLLILAEPAPMAAHHIFEETIDQEFPPSFERRRNAIRSIWPKLSQRFDKPVAIFGAGRHTGWMLQQVSDLKGPQVACILDDRATPDGRIEGVPVRAPSPEDANRFAAILISSWFQHDAIVRRCRDLYGPDFPVIVLNSDSTECAICEPRASVRAALRTEGSIHHT